jgi:predicted Zn-dependent protease
MDSNMGHHSRRWAFLIAGIFSLALGSANAGLLVSEKEILRAARVQWLTMKKQMPLDPNPRTQRYVECVADRIINVLEKPYDSMPWEVVVFDDDATNAFAMPGGKIAVFTGIFKVADTPDALAVVLGHEIAHVTHDHVMERAKRESRSDMLVILGTAATGIPPDLLNQGAAIGLNLPYSRNQETEADKVGLLYMAEAGFDPRASIALWRNMSTLTRGSPPEFLSDHPSDDKRMDGLVKSLTPALIAYNKAQEGGRRPVCRQ